MPKKTLFGLITLAIFFMMPNVYAKEYIVLNTPKAFKDSPSGSRITSIVMKESYQLLVKQQQLKKLIRVVMVVDHLGIR